MIAHDAIGARALARRRTRRSSSRRRRRLHEAGVRVRSLTDFYDEWLGKLPIAELERLSLMFDIAEVHASRYARAKRLGDVVIGLVGVAALVSSCRSS